MDGTGKRGRGEARQDETRREGLHWDGVLVFQQSNTYPRGGWTVGGSCPPCPENAPAASTPGRVSPQRTHMYHICTILYEAGGRLARSFQ